MRKLLLPVISLLIGTVCVTAAGTVPAGAKGGGTLCSAVVNGSTVFGDVEVAPGTCILTGVTINGNIVIDNGGALEFDNSRVSGNVTSAGGGEFDSGATTNFDGEPNGKPSTVSGSVLLTNPIDFDFWGGSIGGNLSINGAPPNSSVTLPICGASVGGSVSYQNLPVGYHPLVGDPDGDNFFGLGDPAGRCPGDDVRGSVTFQNVLDGATVENTVVHQYVSLAGTPNSDIENDTIYGSLLCSGGGSVADSSGTTVYGKNTCF